MKKLKLGIIGIGNMGSGHARNIIQGKCPEIEITAIADINPERLEWAKENIPNMELPESYFQPCISWLAEQGIMFKES